MIEIARTAKRLVLGGRKLCLLFCVCLSVAVCEGAGIAGAEWIGLPPDGTAWTGVATNQPPLPKNTVRFRKTFPLRGGEVKRARALVCGLGFSEF